MGLQGALAALGRIEGLSWRILHRHVEQREEGGQGRASSVGSRVTSLPVTFSRSFQNSPRHTLISIECRLGWQMTS